MTNIYAVASTTCWLIWRELSTLWKDFGNSLLDSIIIPVIFILIGGYILPVLGMPSNYGSFMTVSSIMMMCYAHCVWGGAGPLIADLESDRSITYELILPVPAWLLFVKTACAFAIHAMFLNLLTLPIGKLLLMDKFDLSNFSLFKFILIYPTANLMFAFLSAMWAFYVKNSFAFVRLWLRVGNQLFFFSGLQFSWYVLLKAWPTLAYIDLLNPLLYAFEGCRAAVLGQEGNINFWICLIALWAWIALFAFVGIRLFRKKLDCV